MLSQGQEPASNKNLKINDTDPVGSSPYKAKFARPIEELRENGETTSDAANHFKNFLTVDSAFGDDFNALSTFVPTDTSEHLKN